MKKLSDEQFLSQQNQNRDKAILGYVDVPKEHHMSNLKTHEVLDLHLLPNEGQGCFDGSYEECVEYAATQTPYFMYKVVPMTSEMIENHPHNKKILFKQ